MNESFPNLTGRKMEGKKIPSLGLHLLASLLIISAHAAPRTWTDIQGRSLEGEYITSDGATVTLRIAGKEHQIPVIRFSAADQAWITAHKTGASTAALLPPMSQRQIAEFLFKERADSRPTIAVMAGEKFTRVSVPQDLPAADFYVLGIFEQSPGPQPFPWPLLQQMPKLLDLSVASTGPITAEDISHLSALVSPFSLQIEGGVTLDSAAVAAFPRQPSLKLLRVSANLITEKDLPVLTSRFPEVETLFVKQSGATTQPLLVNDQALATALPDWKSLKRLMLTRIPFTAATAAAISTCRKLESLTLENAGPLVAQDFAPLSSLKTLKEVTIRFSPQADAQAIQDVLKNCKVVHQK